MLRKSKKIIAAILVDVYPEYDSFRNEIPTTQNDGLPIYDRGDTLQYLNIS